ncbi:hypothetical protein HC251_25260 (plasmid) [Iamia sp. SCSIO 61187]|uniref:hypothetical protein n=1 Tax=Iamia sp. SCSIO 61187 TaxID=2722752 RepID=UPI001C625D30|nr:hypothetical protein [Iamia sp. SCSIO 61187]QYG95860.1 hypothetical protein HC251_25260 [Iamia sp. SCSIO 61187]
MARAQITTRSTSPARGGGARAGRGRPGAGGPSSPLAAAAAIVGVLVVAALMVAAALWFRGRGDDESSPTTTTAPPATTEVPPEVIAGAGPTRLEDGIPVGFAHSADGATAAVMSWTPFYGRTEDPEVAFQLLEVAWLEETYDEEYAAEERARGRTLGAYADRGELDNLAAQGTPLAYRVESYDDDEAQIAVWDVAIIAQEPDEGPEAIYRTVTWTLRWDEDAEDWRVYTVAIDTGPTPALGFADESDGEQVTSRLDGYTYWDPYGEREEPWPVVRVPDGGETAEGGG